MNFSDSSSCSTAGFESPIASLLATLSPEASPDIHFAAARELKTHVERIAAAPETSVAGAHNEWFARKCGNSFSLFAPGWLVTAQFSGSEATGLNASGDSGDTYQFDFPSPLDTATGSLPADAPLVRVRAYRDFHCVADNGFLSDGQTRNLRDWQRDIREGLDLIDRTMAQFPTPEAMEFGQLPDIPRPGFAEHPNGMPQTGDLAGQVGRAVASALGGLAAAAAAQPTTPPPTVPKPPVRWHYIANGKTLGPVSEPELRDILTRHSPDTLVWNASLPGWQKASSLGLTAIPELPRSQMPAAPHASCPRCAHPTKPGAKFCPSCGQKLPPMPPPKE